jgi:hypothetical protein
VPGFVYVVVAGKLYRIDVMSPLVVESKGRKTLRVDGRIAGEPMAFSLWLSADLSRVPLRVEVTADDARVSAELVE